ncbi:hypothetical protein ABKN59_008520 [Abortiporus biennis]
MVIRRCFALCFQAVQRQTQTATLRLWQDLSQPPSALSVKAHRLLEATINLCLALALFSYRLLKINSKHSTVLSELIRYLCAACSSIPLALLPTLRIHTTLGDKVTIYSASAFRCPVPPPIDYPRAQGIPNLIF